MFAGITSVGIVVRVEAGEAVPPDVLPLPEVLADLAVCEPVQPASATAQQTRTISTRIVLAFIPDDDWQDYLLVAIPFPKEELEWSGSFLAANPLSVCRTGFPVWQKGPGEGRPGFTCQSF
jgi:hypothetical protein